MFERCTERSRLVVVLAQQEARSSGSEFIGTEHLLLALIKEHDGVAASSLASWGITYELVQERLGETVDRVEHPGSGHIPFTPRAKRVLERSFQESLKLGQTFIGTEHLLLGVIRVRDGVASKTLVELGVDLDEAHEQLLRSAAAGSDPDDSPAAPG